MTTTIKDPTRAELIAFLEGIYPAETGNETAHTEVEAESDDHDGCGCRFDIEEAAYWLAVHYHSGGGSNLYAALSVSEFRPGPWGDLPDDLENENCERVHSTMLYFAGADWLRGA